MKHSTDDKNIVILKEVIGKLLSSKKAIYDIVNRRLSLDGTRITFRPYGTIISISMDNGFTLVCKSYVGDIGYYFRKRYIKFHEKKIMDQDSKTVAPMNMADAIVKIINR